MFKYFLHKYLCYWIIIYFYRQEAEVEDEVDSDFSIDENDEPVSDHEAENTKKRKKGVQTKAYKEPKTDAPKSSSKPPPAKRRRIKRDKDNTRISLENIGFKWINIILF